MSDFEPSPRSSKRRKIQIEATEQSTVPPTVYDSISQKVQGISRRLFRSRKGNTSLRNTKTGENVADSAYGSKEDSLEEENPPNSRGDLSTDTRAEASDSADELASPEVTATPTKGQRSGSKRTTVTPKSSKMTPSQNPPMDSVDTSAQGRSSGRERRRPKRYSTDLPDTNVERQRTTPSKKSVKQKTVELPIETTGAEDDPGFKEVTTPTKSKGKSRVKKNARSRLSSARDVAPEQSDTEIQLHETEDPDEATLEVPEEEEEALVVPEPPILEPAHTNIPLPEADPELDRIKSLVISRLTSRTLTPLTNLETEYTKIHSLLTATIEAGEGNSILLLGSRGSGKTCLVETAISDLSTKYSQDFHVVRLNGFIQTDDRLALREIWRQLAREMQVEDTEVAQVSSYADTMASLLHLLSHPEELDLVENLNPDAPLRTARSVIFVLDEFDLFATHPRQTLLYNLFDIAQARKAPIAVIGTTTRIDIADNLEKRVKSRFSHRWVHLPLAKSLPAFTDVAKAALLVDEEVVNEMKSGISIEKCRAWNTFIEEQFLPSPPTQDLLKRTFYTTKSIPDLFSSLHMSLLTLTSLSLPQHSHPPSTPFTSTNPPDSILSLLPHLPQIHLSLIIAATRLEAIYSATILTFPLVYDHYVSLVSRARLQSSAAGSLAQGLKLWSREVGVDAWEDLARWEVLVPVGAARGGGGKAGLWRCDVVLEEIVGAIEEGGGMGEVMRKWCKEV